MIENRIPKETAHGSVSFPLSVYKSGPNFDQCILYSHYHDEVEFFYLISGQATFFIDTKPIEISAGEALFINSGQIHCAYSDNFSNCEFYAIVFNLNMLNSSTLGECQNKYIYPLIQKQYEVQQKFSFSAEKDLAILDQLNIIIDQYINNAIGYEISITACLYLILSHWITHNMLTLKSPINSDLTDYKLSQFKKVLAFIQANYSKKITVLDMANEINMSQYHFCRFFKKMSGSTPFEYLVNYRINEAEKLLSTTNKKIFDIALDVGFDTVSYFIKTFKKIKKNTPSKFREAYIKC